MKIINSILTIVQNNGVDIIVSLILSVIPGLVLYTTYKNWQANRTISDKSTRFKKKVDNYAILLVGIAFNLMLCSLANNIYHDRYVIDWEYDIKAALVLSIPLPFIWVAEPKIFRK